MPWEHARYCGLGRDAIVIACSRNTNIIMSWAWMHYLSYALGTRTLLWCGHGCAIVCSRNTNVIMVWEWMHNFWYAFGTRTFLWLARGCAIVSMLSEPPMPLFIVCSVCSRNTNVILVWAWMRDSMLSEHDVIMVWAWMHYLSYALGTRTLLWFGHGCAIVCSQNTNVIMVWARMHSLSYALGTRTLLWCGHGCTCYRMLSEHERYCGLGMDAR